jgi:NAD-dependent DNA ligase
MIRHIVLLRRHPEATDAQIEDLVAALRRLPETIPEIRSYDVQYDEVGGERSATFGLISHFDNLEALRCYQAHPDHQAVLATIRAVTEWSKVWDYTVDTEQDGLA